MTYDVHGDMLAMIFEKQLDLQRQKMGGDPYTFTNEKRIQFYKDMHIALIDELHEALNEMGWKPWAKSAHFYEDAVQGELVDALHFLVNLCLVAGMTAEDLFAGYVAKNAKNHKRQEEGYDGIATKCLRCKRALDDDAVGCWVDNNGSGWCQRFGVWSKSSNE